MDCRRQARKRGLVILGTRKIWDSSLAAIGMLWAKRHGKRQFRAYHDRVFERFRRRELDVEDPEAIAAVLSEVDADTTGFRSFLTGAAGRIEHDAIRESAEAAGVFGVPSFIVDGELFWGREHLADIREKLAPVLDLHERPALCGRIRYVPGPLSGQPLLAPPDLMRCPPSVNQP